jgi:hypothetical protein
MRSWFRVKYYSYLFSAFVLFLYATSEYRPLEPEHQFVFITVPMMVLGLLAITLKCERCRGGLFNLHSPRNSFGKLFSVRTYFLPKRCPNCGCERY